MSRIFDLHPALQIVHHKGRNLKNVHISYVTRTNPLPQSLENALIEGYERFVFEYTRDKWQGKVDIATLFENKENKVFIEIGFGNGENSFRIAEHRRDINFFAFDVYLKGLAQYTQHLLNSDLDNVQLCRYDAEDFIYHSVADNSIDGFNIFFPDPWIKRKQSKRRIINPEFTTKLVSCLKMGGIIHTATDIEAYAMQMKQIFDSIPHLQNKYSNTENGFAPSGIDRFVTSFEKKGLENKRKIFDLVYKKTFI